MQSLSLWAHRHRHYAISLIVVLQITFVFLALSTGILLRQQQVILPGAYAYAFLGIMALLYLYYPHFAKKYRSRKWMELAFLFFSFWAGAFWSNQFGTTQPGASPVFASVHPIKPKKPTAQQIIESLKYRHRSSLTRVEKRILKKELNVQAKQYLSAKLSGDKEKSRQIWLTIAVIVGSLGVLYLVAALSCTISCNGGGSLSIVVLIFGIAAVIWGSTLLLRNIYNRKKRKKQTEQPTPPEPPAEN